MLQNGKVEIYYAIEGASGYGTVARDSCFLLCTFMPMIIGKSGATCGTTARCGYPAAFGIPPIRRCWPKEAFMREHQREPDIVELAKAMDVPKEGGGIRA